MLLSVGGVVVFFFFLAAKRAHLKQIWGVGEQQVCDNNDRVVAGRIGGQGRRPR